jgi:hypothetical protein
VYFLGSPCLQAEEATTGPKDPEVIRLHLMDGSTIAGKLSVKELEVETKFGKLQIPITSIYSFTPGLGSHPELSGKVAKLIENLGGADYDQRESAQKELKQMGESIRPELQKWVADADKERRERIRALLEELDSQLHDGDGEEGDQPGGKWLVSEDVIETTEFITVGKIMTSEFAVSSKYGPLKIKLSDIRRGERSAEKPEVIEKSLTVDGSHLVQRKQKEVQIRVNRGDTIKISAEGNLTMTPWGRNSISSPDGAGNFGWMIQNQIPVGMLVATVGNNQDYIKVGSKSTFQAPRTGMLRLGIAMIQEQANHQFPGMYNVKVIVERKR